MRVNGVVATRLPSFQLVGEASLLENLQSPNGELHPKSRATVVAAPGTTYVKWPQKAFYELQQEEDSDFAYAHTPPLKCLPSHHAASSASPHELVTTPLRHTSRLSHAASLLAPAGTPSS